MKTNKGPIKPTYATVEYWALNKAFQRFIFRNPFFEGEVFSTLPQYDRNQIVKEALEIQEAK